MWSQVAVRVQYCEWTTPEFLSLTLTGVATTAWRCIISVCETGDRPPFTYKRIKNLIQLREVGQ